MFDTTIPVYPGNNIADDLDKIRENFEWIDRFMMMSGIVMMDGYKVQLSYTSGNLTGVTVKDSGDSVQGTATLAYTGDDLTSVTWAINGQILTYTLTYSAGDLSQVELNIT